MRCVDRPVVLRTEPNGDELLSRLDCDGEVHFVIKYILHLRLIGNQSSSLLECRIAGPCDCPDEVKKEAIALSGLPQVTH